MTELRFRRRVVSSVFQLLGERENDMTASLGWALSRCPQLLAGFLRAIDPQFDPDDATIQLQEFLPGGGITDIEIWSPERFHFIVEAKRGWALPTLGQLQRYRARRSFYESGAPVKRIVVLSECTRDYAKAHHYPTEIDGISVYLLSWIDLLRTAKLAIGTGSHAEKRVIAELVDYLGRVTTVQPMDSNLAYVVALASGRPERWGISWIEIVSGRHYYFHPVGRSGWPKEPPNYIAFRYGGRLQSIHHIEDYSVIRCANSAIPEIPAEEIWTEDHFLYSLGPGFGPSEPVWTGRIWPNGRVWCMLDTLFTSGTIAEARDVTRERLARVTA